MNSCLNLIVYYDKLYYKNKRQTKTREGGGYNVPTDQMSRTLVKLTPGTLWARGQSSQTTPRLHNSVENIAELASIFRGYFDVFTSGDYNARTARTLAVMYLTKLSLIVTEEIVLKSIRLYTGKYSYLSLMNNHFFDKAHGNEIASEINSSDLPQYNNRYDTQDARRIVLPVTAPNGLRIMNTIAYYLMSPNDTLITTDWAHNEITVEFVKERIKNELVEKLHLVKKFPRVRRLKPINIKLGCDPEFEVLTPGNTILRASDLHTISDTGSIGRDGCGQQIEFRPRPGKPDDLVTEIETLFRQYSLIPECSNTSLCFSGHTYPVGGHIHIGLGRRLSPTTQFLQLLDDFVGIPSIDCSGRARGSYRRMSAYESKNWGFEYRTPPAILFYNPTLTRISLKLIYNLTNRYVNITKEISYHKPVGHNELVEIGGLTTNEARYYLKKLDHLKKLIATGAPIEAKWGTNAKREENNLLITFSDDWNEIIKTNFISLLTSYNTLLKKTVALHFFGLKAERGLVSTIKIDGFELVTDKIPTIATKSDGTSITTLKIGLPFDFRTSIYTYTQYKVDVCKSIKTLLKGLAVDGFADMAGGIERRNTRVRLPTLQDQMDDVIESHVPSMVRVEPVRPSSILSVDQVEQVASASLSGPGIPSNFERSRQSDLNIYQNQNFFLREREDLTIDDQGR